MSSTMITTSTESTLTTVAPPPKAIQTTTTTATTTRRRRGSRTGSTTSNSSCTTNGTNNSILLSFSDYCNTSPVSTMIRDNRTTKTTPTQTTVASAVTASASASAAAATTLAVTKNFDMSKDTTTTSSSSSPTAARTTTTIITSAKEILQRQQQNRSKLLEKNNNNNNNNNNNSNDIKNNSNSRTIHSIKRRSNDDPNPIVSSQQYQKQQEQQQQEQEQEQEQQQASSTSPLSRQPPSFFATTKPKRTVVPQQQQQKVTEAGKRPLATTKIINIIKQQQPQPPPPQHEPSVHSRTTTTTTTTLQQEQEHFLNDFIPPSPKDTYPQHYDHRQQKHHVSSSFTSLMDNHRNTNNNGNYHSGTVSIQNDDIEDETHHHQQQQHRYSFFADQSMIQLQNDDNEDEAMDATNDTSSNKNNHNDKNGDSDNDDDDNDNDTTDTKYHNASSIAIVPSVFCTNMKNNNNNDSQCNQLVVQSDHQKNHFSHTDNDDDDDDDDHSVFVQQQQEDEGNVKETIWEEEATPSQTQFGKMLLFQRPVFKRNPDDDDDDDDDDILSTTSEHGSVLSMKIHQQPQDGATVNDISIHRMKSPPEIDYNVALQHPLTMATVDTSASTQYQTPSQDISNNDDDNIDNTNPVVCDNDRMQDGTATQSVDNDTTVIKEQPQPQQQDLVETQSSLLCYSKSMIEEAEVVDEIEEEAILYTTNKSHFDDGQQPDLPVYGSVKSTTDFLFTKNNNLLMKRLIGGVSNSKGSSNPQRYPISQSAPTTPRASTTWYTSTTTTTPSTKNNPVITTARHTPSNISKNQTATTTASTALPSSFLLRSPGSIAFQSASKSRDNQTIDNSQSTYSSWFTGGSIRTVLDDKINEVTTDDDGNVVGVDSHDLVRNNKELLQQHFPNTAMISTTTKTNPFHLVARSCFSFDAAYDTSMDDQYEFSLPTATTIDNDDAADNDDETAPSTSFQYTTSGIVTTATSNSLDQHVQRHLPIPELNHPTLSSQGKTFQQRPFPNMSSTNSSSIFKRPIAGAHHEIGYSASWDVSTTATSTASSGSPIKRYNTKSRLLQSQQQQRSDYRRLFRQNPTRWGINTGSNKNVKTNYPPSVSTLTTGLSSSPTKPIRNVNDAYLGTENTVQQLKSPQRIEIERDDAIDILACLVERGVSWKQQDQAHSNSLNEPLTSIKNNVLYPTADPSHAIKHCSSGLGIDEEDDDNAPSPADIAAIVEELQGLSLAEENLGNYSTNNTAAHEKRKLALEELLRSHEYAVEMKRASKSASSWLQSIGRSQSSSPTKKMSVTGSPARNVILSESTTPSTSPYREEDMQATTETTANTRAYNTSQIQAAGEESSASDNMDLLTAKAMLHSAQIEAKEKSDLAERLNEELAKCRAEIGRLKSSAQSMSFRSPNRSILDESDDEVVDDDNNDTDEKKYDDMKVVAGDPRTDPSTLFDNDQIVDDENSCLDSSFLPEDAPGDGIDKDLELERYKAALKEANSNIRNLYASLLQHSNEYDVGNVPFVTVSSNERVHVTEEDPGQSGRQSYTIEPTDTNNFTTEWDELSPPLTNPPDHDLKSPIVRAVLELWTDDLSLQESLMNWVDQVLDGDDPDSIPPLTLSNLDHQARDGLVFHILPLLLRRPDVLVDVKTRTCRRTTYDLSVCVDRVTDYSSQVRLDSCTQVDGEQPLRFDPVLTPSSNGIRNMEYSDYGAPRSIDEKVPAMSRLSYDEVAEDLALSDTSQPGFISTLGGALGGLLLSRSRKSLSSDPIAPIVSTRRSIMNGTNMNMPTIIESPHTVSSSSDAHAHDDVVRFVEMDHDDLRGNTSDQPYHRVVSAPSGRIGVTFIDYRGHCMVSDVYHDSPLVGWIFPSDVLIAIDDIPVAGTPIRDIIKLLKDRSQNPQRALRVISSHAMNALTLNASAIMNDVTG